MSWEAAMLEIDGKLRARLAGKVIAGPFAGMQMPNDAQLFYLLGTYEKELHSVLGEINSRKFHAIINVGACHGYYAVGLARLHPEASVVAFEVNEKLHPALLELARANGVALDIRGMCTLSELSAAIFDGAVLVVMDCEGGEKELLDPACSAGLQRCTILVELHEFIYADIAEQITERFTETHSIRTVGQELRTVEDVRPFIEPGEFSTGMWPAYKPAVDENRPYPMRWLCMVPKTEVRGHQLSAQADS